MYIHTHTYAPHRFCRTVILYHAVAVMQIGQIGNPVYGCRARIDCKVGVQTLSAVYSTPKKNAEDEFQALVVVVAL